MQVFEVIGYLGADAEVKTSEGRRFCVFRVADSERWTDQTGKEHERTQWIDCILSADSKVIPYLLRGTLVRVSGPITLRTYPSGKDRCWKAGITLNVRQVDLLGGRTDVIPSRLTTQDGQIVEIAKAFFVANPALREALEGQFLFDRRLVKYHVSAGWVDVVQAVASPDGAAADGAAADGAAADGAAADGAAADGAAADGAAGKGKTERK